MNGKRGRGAFTLIEILISVSIMSVCLVLVFVNIMSSKRGTQATLEEIQGCVYAEDLIDRIKSMGYKCLPPGNFDCDDDAGIMSKLTIKPDDLKKVPENFTRKLWVRDISESFFGEKRNLKLVTVEVGWNVFTAAGKGPRYREAKIKLATIIRETES